MKNDNQMLIMCGGRGSRLGKITGSLPKPLLNLHGQTILDFKISRYRDKGFTKFIFCLGYKGDMIREAVMGRDDIVCVFSDAGEKAGILERLYHARELFGNTIVMSYGDTFADIDFRDLIKKHNESNCEVTIVTASIQSPFGLVTYDEASKVSSFIEKPIQNHYIGYAVINSSALDLIPNKVTKLPDGEGLVAGFKILSAMKTLNAYNYSGLQITVNTEEDLQNARKATVKYFTIPEK